MTCGVQSDLDMFPGCSDVVRVHTARWESRHNEVLERLLQNIGAFLEEHSGSSFPNMLSRFEENDIRVRVGDQFAHILYGPEPLSVSPDGELQMDIRGLVCKPQAQVVKGKLVVEFG